MCADTTARRVIPDATVARLPGYLRVLSSLSSVGTASVSSEELADAAHVRPTQVRKDLSLLGSYGVRGVGYDVIHLGAQISAALGLARQRPVAIVGMGNLGRALAAYAGFGASGFTVRALVDDDPAMTGTVVAGLPVTALDSLADVVAEHGVVIGVIATPAAAAQSVCDRLVAAGVRSILTFAPTVLRAGIGVRIRQVDLATELHLLTFHDGFVDAPSPVEVGS